MNETNGVQADICNALLLTCFLLAGLDFCNWLEGQS